MEDDQRDLTDRVSRLEEGLTSVNERLRRLEALAGAGARPAAEVGAPPEAVPAPQPVALTAIPPFTPATPLPMAARAAPRPLFRFPQLSGELELLIGTSWLNRIGIIAIIAAAAFFLKYAFDNNWIGPAGRVALTLLAGVVLVLGGERYQRRGLPTFGQGLTGGGIVVLYLGMFAAFEIYRLIGFAPAFALMVLITASATLLALRYDSKVIALLSLIGGFATPLVLGDGGDGAGGSAKPVTAALYVYFLALDAGGYALVRYKRWTWLGGVVLAAAFLTPVIVTSSARPNPSAALVYFLAVTAATLALSAITSLAALAWVALVGGFVLGPWAGVWQIGTTSPLVALGYFAAVTLGAMYLAGRYRWRGVALAALIAGALSGITLDFVNGAAYRWAIFPYLVFVGGSALYAGVRHEWRWVEWIATIVTGGAATLAALDTKTLPALPGVTAVFLTFSLTAALASRRRAEIRLVTAILAAAIYGGQMLLILETRDLQALAALGLSAYHLVVGRVLLRRAYPQLTVLVLAGLALTFLTIAIPLKLRAEGIPLAWSIETAVLAWAAGRLGNTWAGRAAAIVGALAAARLLLYETPLIAQAGLVATPPGVAFAVGVAALAVGAYFTRSVEWSRDEERYIPAGLVAAAAALLLWWGGWEINGLGERGAIGAGSKQALLSAWLTLYGFALVVAGIVKEVPSLRWAGIGLLGLTIGKVFLVDLAQVEIAYRIVSLLVLGILLVTASLIYGRYRTRLGTPAAKGGRT